MEKKSRTYLNYQLKKKTYLGLFLFLTGFILNAQISGTATNNKKEPVAFATALLNKYNSKLKDSQAQRLTAQNPFISYNF